jgi:hypothetical protein
MSPGHGQDAMQDGYSKAAGTHFSNYVCAAYDDAMADQKLKLPGFAQCP